MNPFDPLNITDLTGKTIYTNPYDYDPFTIFDLHLDHTHQVYTDRLWSQNMEKHDELCIKHFGERGQRWEKRESHLIQEFLRDYYDNEKIVLIRIDQHCNVSNGFPLWCLFYHE